jgi:hypothetical protein
VAATIAKNAHAKHRLLIFSLTISYPRTANSQRACSIRSR